MGERPTGTVTFLFTDIEGSTRLWQTLGEDMARALARHDRIVRDVVTACDGAIFSTAGDGFGAAFWTTEEAVAAAVAVQREMAKEQLALRVRMGIHVGSCVERDGDYFGPTVNFAARLMAAGHGGQVLVSAAAAALLREPHGLIDLGEYALKDIPDLHRVWQAGGASVPPLRSTGPAAGNLPVASRSFIGRVNDVVSLVAEVHPGRVLTLTGVGGVGKTRLALAAASQIAGNCPDGAWWCDLASIEDPAGVLTAVANVLSVRLGSDVEPLDAVVRALGSRNVLVVLDNCEHVLGAVADLVDAAVRACPSARFVTTSREPLGVSGERVWPVRPLDPTTEGYDLFVDRAVAADASFDPSDHAVPIAELCRRLDGIPLAIELAAARVRSLTPSELVERLSDRFRLLRGSSRGGIDRQRTLQATLDWSYMLLADAERTLLDRLSVFGGSFDRVAAGAVCGDALLDPVEIEDVLVSLVDKSLVEAMRSREGTRLRLLETVRQYAEQHLAGRHELDTWRDRHLGYYLAATEEAGNLWMRDYRAGRLAIDGMWDNIRVATQHALRSGATEATGRMLRALADTAMFDLRYEVLDWSLEAISAPDAGPVHFAGAAAMSGMVGRANDQVAYARAGLAGAVAADATVFDTMLCKGALAGGLALTLGHESARSAAEAVYAASLEMPPPIGPAWAGLWAGAVAMGHSTHEADVWAERAAAQLDAQNTAYRSATLGLLSFVHQRSGRFTAAQACADRLWELACADQIPWSRSIAAVVRAQVAAAVAPDARQALTDSIESIRREGIWFDLWAALAATLRWWTRAGAHEAAGTVLGFMEADGNGAGRVEPDVLEVLEGHRDRAHWAVTGSRMDRETVIAFALDRLRPEASR